MSRFEVVQSASIFNSGIKVWQKKVDDAIAQALFARRDEITEWMQQNAPWTDITGRARASLHTNFEEAINFYILELTFGSDVTYAKYLEYDHAGKFAILRPSIDYWAPIIMEDMQKILS